jgi:hypothetical protein
VKISRPGYVILPRDIKFDSRWEFALLCDAMIWDEVVVPCIHNLLPVVVLGQRERDPWQRLHDSGRDQGLELLVRNTLPRVYL